MKKIKVGILGATGMVGQQYISLLQNHNWFDISFLAASPRSAGKTYKEATYNRWLLKESPINSTNDIVVNNVTDISEAIKNCDMVFSAFEISDKNEIRRIENEYAKAGLPVVSNASAHRWTKDVPILIPEINYKHSDIIKFQQENNGWKKGFVAVKPNCSIQSFMMPLDALRKFGFDFKEINITTLQAVSGAGYPGVSSLDMIDNVVPFIGGEEEKTESEPKKIFGSIKNGNIQNDTSFKVSATCTRVPVSDGHIASVSIKFNSKKPTIEQTIDIFKEYISEPQRLKLPSAPKEPILYLENQDRPQPVKDRNKDKAMSCYVGRVRKCEVNDIKFIGMNHNTIRGAAGGGVLNAELLVKQGFILPNG